MRRPLVAQAVDYAGAYKVGVISLIIPVIEEEVTIGSVVKSVPGDIVNEIIVVDGGSRDATVERAREAGARVLIEPGSGYGGACWAGFEAVAADCAIVVFIDGDGSDDPAEIPRLVHPIIADEADFVIGSRVRGERERGSMSIHQLLAGHIAGTAIKLLYRFRYTDMGPLRAIRRHMLEELGMRERTYGWNLEMQMRAARAGLRIVELPVRHRVRGGGRSKVAGNLTGTLKASIRLATAFVRVAAEK
jgi:glycosyltransferase involved in cell wall biosynthesis